MKKSNLFVRIQLFNKKTAMKKVYILFTLCTLLVLTAGSALAQPVPGCSRAADEVSRLETARAILKVGSDDYKTVINGWAEVGAGADGVGFDGAVYQETVLSNFTRQEMYDYLDVIFGWSEDMELDIIDELWETHPDGSMTYMATNVWHGMAASGPYTQPGMSIVKFRPGEGCACYQRDYFTEGDTWWGIPVLGQFVKGFRDQYIILFGLTERCFDEDGDGYSKYGSATGCENEGTDCNDYVAEINPGAEEIPGNEIDDNCDGWVDEAIDIPIPGPGTCGFAAASADSGNVNYAFALWLFGLIGLSSFRRFRKK